MKHWLGSAAAGAGLALLAMGAGAQGTGRGGFPPPPPSPQMRAKFQTWQKWQGSHKNVTALQQMLGGLQDLERDPQTCLNKKQASAVLAVLNQWRSQPVITDSQARQVVQQIKAPLNRAQIKTLAMVPPGPRGFGGPPPGGPPPPGGFGGGPGGPPPPGGRFGGPPSGGPPPGGMNPAAFPSPKDYNPLNPSTVPFKRQVPQAKQRLADLMTALSRAK